MLLMFTLGGAMLFTVPRASVAACDDDSAMAAFRVSAEAACEQEGHGCTTATNHGDYVSCIAEKARAAVDAQTLPRQCKGAATRCAAKSTCGKPGFVTCCRTKPRPGGSPSTKCTIKHGADHCIAPKGGTACAGTQSSCCDACVGEGCVGSPGAAFLE
jgi:hypothetical protein